MNAWQKKLDNANTQYEQALARLAREREAYETGAGKNLAEVTINAQHLREMIVQHNEAAEAAKVALGNALRASNAAPSKASKAALVARRDAEDMAETCQAMLDETVTTQIEATFAADDAAQTYEGAWQAARAAQIEQIAYAALVQYGEGIAQAMAAGAKEIIQKELADCTVSPAPEAQTRRAALGQYNPGALHDGDRVGPNARNIVRRAIAGEKDSALMLPNVLSRPYLSPGFADALRALMHQASTQ